MSSDDVATRCDDTRDAAAALLEDVDHILAMVGGKSAKREEARRLSPILRRLLIEDDLKSVAAPRIGRIQILASDFSQAYLEIAQHSGTVAFYGLDPAPPIFPFHSVSMGRGLKNYKENKKFFLVEQFTRQNIIYFDKTWISRHSLIRYIANEKSGVHTEKERMDQGALERIAKLETTMEFSISGNAVKIVNKEPNQVSPKSTYVRNTLSPVLVAMISTANTIIKSPDVIRLAEYIRSELI